MNCLLWDNRLQIEVKRLIVFINLCQLNNRQHVVTAINWVFYCYKYELNQNEKFSINGNFVSYKRHKILDLHRCTPWIINLNSTHELFVFAIVHNKTNNLSLWCLYHNRFLFGHAFYLIFDTVGFNPPHYH